MIIHFPANRLEEYIAFTVNKNLLFIDSMKFMSSSLDVLIKILSHNDSKYLSQEFSGGLLELIKQKHAYPYDYMNSFKIFFDDKLPDRCKFYIGTYDVCKFSLLCFDNYFILDDGVKSLSYFHGAILTQ